MISALLFQEAEFLKLFWCSTWKGYFYSLFWNSMPVIKVGSVHFQLLTDDLNLKFYFKGQKAGILQK